MAVYFAQQPNGYIKIGKSYAVQERLKVLSDQNSASLKLLGVIAGDLSEEKELHLKFDATRVTGEWFLPTTALLDFIEHNAVTLEDLTEAQPVKETLESVVGLLALNIGNRSLKTLNKVAKALNCSIEDLFVED